MITEYCESCAHKLHCQQKINSIFKCSDYKNYDEISLAKKRYYKFKEMSDNYFGGITKDITDYVEELEKEIKRLKNNAV